MIFLLVVDCFVKSILGMELTAK
jgi:hypothetical protein